jgi:hypothetical protein
LLQIALLHFGTEWLECLIIHNISGHFSFRGTRYSSQVKKPSKPSPFIHQTELDESSVFPLQLLYTVLHRQLQLPLCLSRVHSK